MNPHHIRIASGLLAVVLVSALLKLALIDIRSPAAPDEAAFLPMVGASLAFAFIYVLPLAALAVFLSERLRIRSAAAHLALGTASAFVIAHFAVIGETLSSPAFSGGALTAFAVLVIGLLSSLAYWCIAGRMAGWRGDGAEHDDKVAFDAFRTASANAQFEHCKICAAGRAAAGGLLFLLLCWVSISASGLREWLIDETEARGNTALKGAGFEWATFTVKGSRGVLQGTAPDEVQLRSAHDMVRETLDAVTGFPGILAKIENAAVAHMPMSAMSRKLAEATRSETEARVDAEAARIATAAARAAEAEAKRKAEEQVLAAEIEIKRKTEEQALAAEAEFRRKTAEHTIAAEAEIKRKTEEQALAAEAEIRRRVEEQARIVLAEDAARKQAAQEAAKKAAEDAAQKVDVAAVENGTSTEATAELQTAPPAGEPAGANSPALDAETPSRANACTSQDLAIVEGGRILFEAQRFEIMAGDETEIDMLAASARACAPRPILISGHADANSDSLFNPALALQRARSVRDKLIERGVSSGLVIAESAGTSALIDNGATQESRTLNRRTEFRFLEAAETSRDAKLDPEERANTCEGELSGIMAQSIIHFPIASSRIDAESMGLVKKLANAIQTCGSVIVTVEGHTDKIGGANYNQGLSEARANAVREALVISGADPTRLASRGFASSRPYDSADTAEAFALNRRIEFKVSGKFTTTNSGGP
mgnify:CR=1 FL=1